MSLVSGIAECAQGKFAGSRVGAVWRFAGIPYAKPPIGPLRWRMAEPIAPHAGTRDAAAFGKVSPQGPTPLDRFLGNFIGEQSEDCLFLNVWTPSLEGRRSVMVWLHGGAFIIGAGSQGIYDGTALALHDVVVVTVNYRLGAVGFLALHGASNGALPATGNEGLSDQIAALKWVKDNIAAFGGDADNVTVFGESAGGMSIGALLAAPSANGLFHKAIVQSGGAHIGHDEERAHRQGRAFLDALGLAPSEADKAAELPVGALLNAQIRLTVESRAGKNAARLGQLPFQPSIDGALIPRAPIEAVREGSAAGIPLLTGTTLEEWRLFTGPNPALRLMREKTLMARFEKLGGDAAGDLAAAYREGSVFDRFNALMTDKVFTVPCVRLLEAQGAYAPVYAYRFDWKSKLLGGIMGACHAIEIGFVFATHKERLASAFFGAGPEAETLSAAVMRAWTDFAKTGSPGWAPYDTKSRATMVLGDGAPRLTHDPNSPRRQAWASVPDRRVGP